MTNKEYNTKKAAIDSLCEMMKGTSTNEEINKLRTTWMKELEEKRNYPNKT